MKQEVPAEGAFAQLRGLLEDNSQFNAYITKLPTRLGRWHEAGVGDPSFVSLGKTKSISRKHIVIDYSVQLGAFTATVIGKNGVTIVDEHFYPTKNPDDKTDTDNQVVELRNGDALRVMGTRFYFLEALHDKSPEDIELLAFNQLQLAHNKDGSSLTSTDVSCAIMETSDHYRHTCGNTPKFESLKVLVEEALSNCDKCTFDTKTKRYSIAP